jgi:hypothetical protein
METINCFLHIIILLSTQHNLNNLKCDFGIEMFVDVFLKLNLNISYMMFFLITHTITLPTSSFITLSTKTKNSNIHIYIYIYYAKIQCKHKIWIKFKVI